MEIQYVYWYLYVSFMQNRGQLSLSTMTLWCPPLSRSLTTTVLPLQLEDHLVPYTLVIKLTKLNGKKVEES